MTLEDFRQEAYIEGFKEGFVIGFKEGYEIGLRKATKKFVFNLLKSNQSDDFIIQTVEISKDQLEEFKKEYAQKQ